MKKFTLFIIVVLFCSNTVIKAQQQKRLILFGSTSWFSFDPLWNNYKKGALEQLASYVDAWREELYDENVFVSHADNFYDKMPISYKIYNKMDRDMLDSIFSSLNVVPIDTTLFPVYKYSADTLDPGTILVVDRIDFFGDISFSHKIVDITDFPHSKKFEKQFSREEQQIRQFFSSPIKNLLKDYSTRDMYFDKSNLGTLLHNYQLSVMKSDISILAPPQKDVMWHKGDLYIKDVLDMLPYDNDLVVMNVKGSLLLDFMEEVYGACYYTVRRPTDDLLKLRTPYFFHDKLAGIYFEVNVTKPRGKRIENAELEPDKIYTVALNSYRCKWFKNRGVKVVESIDYKVYFIEWLLSTDIETLFDVEKWIITPQKWVKTIAIRERYSAF